MAREQWIPLKVLKETNPLEVAEFAVVRGIDDQPVFHWRVPYTLLRECNQILSRINARVKCTTHKYGIEIPKTIDEARNLDKVNNDTHWKDAIHLEMTNVEVAFEILEDGKPIHTCWKNSGHLVFHVKKDFPRKAQWVMDGHKIPTPDGSTYAEIMSRESVRIALNYAALNTINFV